MRYITIHKSQEHNLDMEIIDLENIDRCSGMTLVAEKTLKCPSSVFSVSAVETFYQGQAVTNNLIHHSSTYFKI